MIRYDYTVSDLQRFQRTYAKDPSALRATSTTTKKVAPPAKPKRPAATKEAAKPKARPTRTTKRKPRGRSKAPSEYYVMVGGSYLSRDGRIGRKIIAQRFASEKAAKQAAAEARKEHPAVQVTVTAVGKRL